LSVYLVTFYLVQLGQRIGVARGGKGAMLNRFKLYLSSATTSMSNEIEHANWK